MTNNNHGKKWSREETILAFYYYSKIPFGKIHKSNPEIIRIASLLDRTPSSVALKMCNLAHFDPDLQRRNIRGLGNASKTDEEVVSSFFNNWEELTYKAVMIESQLESIGNIQLPVGMSVDRVVKTRVNQQFFREAVLISYQNSCCITNINIPVLLIASHIKPWTKSNPETERTNPCNGLCLNALHDKAFDKGLITVLPDYTIRVSSKLVTQKDNDGINWIKKYNKCSIHLPERFLPNKEYLQYHNDMVFIP